MCRSNTVSTLQTFNFTSYFLTSIFQMDCKFKEISKIYEVFTEYFSL